MNIYLLKHHTHLQTGRYLDMLYSHNLLPVITKPTRITNHTATLIDHIYTNSVNRLISGVIPVDFSDHLPIFCTVETSLKKHSSGKKGRLRSTSWKETQLKKVRIVSLCYSSTTALRHVLPRAAFV